MKKLRFERIQIQHLILLILNLLDILFLLKIMTILSLFFVLYLETLLAQVLILLN